MKVFNFNAYTLTNLHAQYAINVRNYGSNFTCCYDNLLKHKNDLSIPSKICNFLKTKQIYLTLQVLKKIPSFPSFRSQHKGQNRKLGNLGNSQFPQIKEIHANIKILKKFPSFPSFRFQYKGQNRKVGNLENFQLPPTKQLQALKKFPSFPSFGFQHKGQNRKLGNLGNSQISSNKRNLLKFRSLEKISEFSKFSISV